MDGNANPGGVVTFTVKTGESGTPLPGTVRVMSITVERALDRVTWARMVLQDGSAAEQTFALSESDLLLPGTKVVIDGGYDSDESRIFDGVVTRQRIEARRSGDTLLHVDLKDPAFRTALTRQTRSFADLSEADAITQALSAEGVSVEIEDGDTLTQIAQTGQSGWEFALWRAGEMGLVCDCDGGKVRFFKPDSGASPEATYTFGQDMLTMDLELDGEAPFASVDAAAWDPAGQDVIHAEAEEAEAPGPAATPQVIDAAKASDTPRRAGARTQSQLDALAAARLLRSRLAAVRGVIEVQGTARMSPGQVVELNGLGKRFNGNHILSGIRHELGRGDWLTSLQIGLAPPDARRRPTMAAAGGLIIGTVRQLADDPDGEERVLVTLQTQTDGPGELWARQIRAEAGDGRGAVHRPDNGDEVVIGFLDGDPRDPVILGTLHSSAHPAPIEAADENNIKGYVSRAGTKLVFDDAKPALTLETKAGAKLVLADDDGEVTLSDQNGNSLTMAADKVTLEAAKDLTLKAGGTITIDGVEIAAKASAAAKLEGAGSAAIESSGTTTLKGSLVKIN